MISFHQGPLTVFQSALFQTTSTVVEGEGFVLVADPTWLPDEVAEIAAFVGRIRAGRAIYLLFTHSDFDHILGAGAFPDAVTIASSEFADNPRKEQCAQKVRAWDSEYYVTRPYQVGYPEITILISHDGQTLEIGGARLTFYQAPGHNPDGLFTVIEPQGVLIAGDYLSDIEFPYVYQSSTAYEETLGKIDHILGSHTVRVLVPGHGQVASDQEEIRKRRDESLAYIHKVRRLLGLDNQTALDAMLDGYVFPQGMKSFHEANQALMRREFVDQLLVE